MGDKNSLRKTQAIIPTRDSSSERKALSMTIRNRSALESRGGEKDNGRVFVAPLINVLGTSGLTPAPLVPLAILKEDSATQSQWDQQGAGVRERNYVSPSRDGQWCSFLSFTVGTISWGTLRNSFPASAHVSVLCPSDYCPSGPRSGSNRMKD